MTTLRLTKSSSQLARVPPVLTAGGDPLCSFRLAKATLTLIPLFGIHEVVFIFATDEQTTGILRYVKVFFTLFLNSFQVRWEGDVSSLCPGHHGARIRGSPLPSPSPHGVPVCGWAHGGGHQLSPSPVVEYMMVPPVPWVLSRAVVAGGPQP